MRNSILIFAVFVIGVMVLSLFPYTQKKSKIHPLTNDWEKVVPHQEIPEGLLSLSAESCGACHKKHYEEWKYSTHSHAWTDLQFQAELKKESSPIFCINCHVPLQNQQEFIVKGLIDGDIYQPAKEKNPHFDKALQQEGITCASCHVRNNAIIGSTGTSNAPHKTIGDPEFLSEKLCISCHNEVANITPQLVCTFETGDEWKAGPYFGEENCLNCHMPETTRELVQGGDSKRSRLHYFAGSGIPKLHGAKTKMLNGLAFYPSILEKNYTMKDTVHFQFRVKNEFAGHKVPTGDPERFFNISFSLKNKNGEILASQNERIGEHWEWYPTAKKISDNNLLPKEERTYDFFYQPIQKDKLILSVRVTKNRMDQKAAHYNKMTEDYPLFITIFEEEYEFEIK